TDRQFSYLTIRHPTRSKLFPYTTLFRSKNIIEKQNTPFKVYSITVINNNHTMSTENLQHRQAIEKLSDLVDKIDIGMLCTFNGQNDYPHAIPMSRQEVDENGNIWFLFSS